MPVDSERDSERDALCAGQRKDGHAASDPPEASTPNASELFHLLYTRLHRQAQLEMRRQPPGHTLQATALVNEVFLRLALEDGATWKDRKHFLLTAARAMRQVLIDSARRRNAVKRGGGGERDELGEIAVEFADRSLDLEALHRALEKLAVFDPLMTRAVELRFFAGCGMDEVAELLGLSRRTLDRRWNTTRLWLYGEVR